MQGYRVQFCSLERKLERKKVPFWELERGIGVRQAFFFVAEKMDSGNGRKDLACLKKINPE